MAVPLLFALSSTAVLAAPPAPASPSQASTRTTGDARPIEDLLAAAQRLRDAIHLMALAPAGKERTHAIRAGDRALVEVEQAISNLPPDLLTAEATESRYREAADRLERATTDLHDAAKALARDPGSTRRDETMADVRKAIAETQRLMRELHQAGSQA